MKKTTHSALNENEILSLSMKCYSNSVVVGDDNDTAAVAKLQHTKK